LLERHWYFHPGGEITEEEKEAALDHDAENEKELVAGKLTT